MHALPKFQFHMPRPFEFKALQKIDLYSRYWENKLLVLTNAVTFKCSAVQTHHSVCHGIGINCRYVFTLGHYE